MLCLEVVSYLLLYIDLSTISVRPLEEVYLCWREVDEREVERKGITYIRNERIYGQLCRTRDLLFDDVDVENIFEWWMSVSKCDRLPDDFGT